MRVIQDLRSGNAANETIDFVSAKSVTSIRILRARDILSSLYGMGIIRIEPSLKDILTKI